MRGFIRLQAPNDPDVDDLVQDAWLAVWDRMPSYERARGTAFMAFARPSAVFTLRRHYRKRRKLRERERPLSDLEPGSDGSDVGRSEELHLGSVTDDYPLEVEVDWKVYEDLLRVTFGGPSPPHQLLAFGWSKLIAKWPPRRIVAEHSDTPLKELGAALERAYTEQSGLPSACIEPCFALLHRRMDLGFSEVVFERRTLEIYPELRGRVVGTTVLRDYYGEDPEQNIAHWSGAVRRRVLKAADTAACDVPEAECR
jgi:hypothetical protein